jgi:hypothetical protein
MKDFEDGFVEELDDKKVRVWKKIGDGGYWTTMSRLRYEGFVDKNKIPFFCPVCNKPMLVDVDRRHYLRNKCCFKCNIYFVEGREERWRSGWRPDENDMVDYNDWRDRKKVFSIDESLTKKVQKIT